METATPVRIPNAKGPLRSLIVQLPVGAGRASGAIVAMMVALLLAGGPGWEPAPGSTSDGYQAKLVRTVTEGVEYRRLVRDQGPVVAHVLRVQRSPSVVLQAVLSNDRVAGTERTKELTSQMCRRVGCIAAINGDFFQPTGEPVGAVARAGRLLRSPDPSHHQLTVSQAGTLTAGPARWSAQLVSSELGSLAIDAVNRQPVADGVTLYTPAWGPTTPATLQGPQIVLRVLEVPPLGGLGPSGLVELISLREPGGGTVIPSSGAVLSGNGAGAEAVRALWQRSRTGPLGTPALFRLETSPSMIESVGGFPLLVREGQVSVVNNGSDLVDYPHPRTMVGWNEAESFLVVVDGRQPGYSVGLTLPEAAGLLVALGARNGINLDGGGSSTLTLHGTVVNRPSDRLVLRDGKQIFVAQPSTGDTVIGHVERPVADALAVVAPSVLSLGEDLAGPDFVSPPEGAAPLGSHVWPSVL